MPCGCITVEFCSIGDGTDAWQKSFVKDLEVHTVQKREIVRDCIITGYFNLLHFSKEKLTSVNCSVS